MKQDWKIGLKIFRKYCIDFSFELSCYGWN